MFHDRTRKGVGMRRERPESRSSYLGSCACPYDVDHGGRRGGRRSAYSKPGGYAPLCYEDDVTTDMIDAYRSRH